MTDTMTDLDAVRVLTLTQPWATLIALGAKKIETRSWLTKYRGLVAIHAAQGLGPLGGHGPNRLAHMCFVEPFRSALVRAYGEHSAEALRDMLPRGAIVATCRLVDCRATDEEQAKIKGGWFKSISDTTMRFWELTPQERAFGDYSSGRYAWLLADIQALPEPIPCKGSLGLWKPSAELQEAIGRSFSAARPA